MGSFGQILIYSTTPHNIVINDFDGGGFVVDY